MKEEKTLITNEISKQLRALFSETEMETVNKRGNNLTYISHATITSRILDIDPNYSFGPVLDDTGRPVIDYCPLSGTPTGGWFHLTIHNVTQTAYGSYEPAVSKETKTKLMTGETKWSTLMDPDAIKKIQSDALTKTASLFGIGLVLWQKNEKIKTIEQEERSEEEDLIAVVRNMINQNTEQYAPVVKELTGKKLVECDAKELRAVRDRIKSMMPDPFD